MFFKRIKKSNNRMDNRLNKEEMNFDKSDKNLRDESIIENQDFKFEEDNFNAIFFASLNEFRSDEVFCDISIKIENKTIKAHKIVLASSIPYFKAMFESNMVENTTNEVEIKENITFTTFEKIINYAYSGKLKGDFIRTNKLIQLLFFNNKKVK